MTSSADAPECDEFRKTLPQKSPPEQDIFLASIYVLDAKLGRHSDFCTSKSSLEIYQLYYNEYLQIGITLNVILHASLALFESPAVPGFSMSHLTALAMELFFLMVYVGRIIHIYLFSTKEAFWKDKKHIFTIVLIGFFAVDIIVNSSLEYSGISFPRLSRPLRPAFATVFPEMRQLRMAFRNLRQTLPEVFNVLILLFFSLAIFALMAFKLFGNRNLKWVDGRPYFNTYWDSFFDLYVLITTANNPDVMMPAYDLNPWYVLFFCAFLVICFFIYMNIILAVIYNNYRQHLKDEVKFLISNKRILLAKAFDLLAESDEKNFKWISRSTFKNLMNTLPQKISANLVHVLWMVLDINDSGKLVKTDFLKLADLLNIEVTEVVKRNIFLARTFPQFYNSELSFCVRKVTCHRFFRYFFDFLTTLNAIVIGISTPFSSWDTQVEWIFLSLFLLEIFLKLYSFGGTRFFRSMWNMFDFIVIISAFLLALIEQASSGVKESRLALDVLLVLRVLRLVKVIGSVKRFKVIIFAIAKILPSLSTYGSVILFVYYFFAIIGMELFGGLVENAGPDVSFCGNSKLNGTDFWMEKYCNNNFNDLLRSFIVLFELTVVNQWHVIAYGFAKMTHPTARLYFMCFHLVCVVLILNIFTAFVLEVFMLEYRAMKDSLETQMERKIHEIGLSMRSEKLRRASTVSGQDLVTSEWDSDDDEPLEFVSRRDSIYDQRIAEENIPERRESLNRLRETDVRFRISKKVSRVESLLQKMFEKEISGELQLEKDEEKSISES